MKKLLFIFGTRPEAIKMAPLIIKAKSLGSFEVKVCVTGQHSEMLYQVLNFFAIRPDYDLAIMRPNQSLFDVTANILKTLEDILNLSLPDLILVQGDTTTTFVGALAAFYKKIPVAHVEAGLRTHNKYSPFPEEINRILTGDIADYHFAVTRRTEENLLRENKSQQNIYTVGNTVIDALFMALELIKKDEAKFVKYFDFIDFSKKIILVTGHRRESFGKPFLEICKAIKEIAERKEIEVIYPMHLNPQVRTPVLEILGVDSNRGIKSNIHLIEPLEYPQLVWLMQKSFFVLTDSGGIQEEAPSLGKPVLVMRDVTERVEGVEAGTCLLVGTKKETITKAAHKLLNDSNYYKEMANAVNPYGDGKAAEKILQIIAQI